VLVTEFQLISREASRAHNDKLVNTGYREGDKWVLVSTRGILHYATAEQFLSHLLPSIMRDDFTVTVKLRDQNENTKLQQ
jgi:hypothetical protein